MPLKINFFFYCFFTTKPLKRPSISGGKEAVKLFYVRTCEQFASHSSSRFINKAASFTEETEYKPVNSFADFALNDKTKATLEYLGFILPTPIQDQCIPIALSGEDVIGLANTGTGKTAAFVLLESGDDSKAFPDRDAQIYCQDF